MPLRLQSALDSYLRDAGVPGAVVGVARPDGREVAGGGQADRTTGAPLSATTPFRIASLTKPVTAAAVVLSARAHGLPLETPVRDLLGLGGDPSAGAELTVDDVLGQVSGLRPGVDAATLAELGGGDDAVREGARLVLEAGQEDRPGSAWAYYNGNYVVAGAAVERLTGTPFESALHDLVLGPWAMAATTFDEPDAVARGHRSGATLAADPYPRARRPSGGLWSTAGDLLTFCERLLADGALLEAVRRPRTPAPSAVQYGLGWALGPGGAMYLNGRLPGYRAGMIMAPEHRFAAVMLVNDEDALPGLAHFLDDLQHPFTGSHLAGELDAFAA